jgi:hypothetical protein
MRQLVFAGLFAIGLVAIAPASFARTHLRAATAARIDHSGAWRRVRLSPNVASSFDAAPGWISGPPAPAVHDDDTPSYNDPSKFGGSTALPIN